MTLAAKEIIASMDGHPERWKWDATHATLLHETMDVEIWVDGGWGHYGIWKDMEVAPFNLVDQFRMDQAVRRWKAKQPKPSAKPMLGSPVAVQSVAKIENRQCQCCPQKTVYRVYRPIKGYSVGPQDMCPGCRILGRASTAFKAEVTPDRLSSLRPSPILVNPTNTDEA